ncbi:hypothetical protein P8C59_004223 [Phyllachora maydis]|uniref:C2H2-type domain-containing protein n=1 Tax=Phyllachora maydis TaxID=1825666 RepID=A0AAD9I1Y3_9PEZI|nr:hypothetical protein P8C59_004223 [Phyllachora maydis]
MSLEKEGPVATEVHLAAAAASIMPPASSALSPPPPPPPPPPESLVAEPSRANSLKRPREHTPPPPPSSPATTSPTADEFSPSKIARLVGFNRESPGPAPAPHAPASLPLHRARDDEQRLVFAAIHENNNNNNNNNNNAGRRVLSALMAGVPAISRSQDAPLAAGDPPVGSPVENDAAGPDTDTDTTAVAVAVAVAVASAAPSQVAQSAPTAAPSGLSSPVRQGAATNLAAATLGDVVHPMVHSPAPMDVDARPEQRLYPQQQQPDAQMDDRAASGSSCLSYPGILPPGGPVHSPGPAPRGITLPVGTSDGAVMGPRSPTSKKHKCPYCETEFTRHHNLKSHLLTHSQEKPYVCQTCNLRFRRLHDLKRHSKLHTGEKPHVCPKCDRKFARGDALARHSKGAGGCAGRRTSMGSFAGEEDFEAGSITEPDASVMGGIIYGDGNADADLTEHDRRRLSLPGIKAQQHVAAPPDSYTTHSSTYPPAGPRPLPGGAGLCPPAVDRPVPGPNVSAAGGQAQPSSMPALPTGAPTPSSLYSPGGIAESPKPLSPAPEGQQRTVHAQHRPAEPPAPPGLPPPTHADNGPGPRARDTGGPAGPVDNANNLFASAGHDKVVQLTTEVEVSKRVEAQLKERIAALTSEVATLRQQLAAAQPSV